MPSAPGMRPGHQPLLTSLIRVLGVTYRSRSLLTNPPCMPEKESADRGERSAASEGWAWRGCSAHRDALAKLIPMSSAVVMVEVTRTVLLSYRQVQQAR
jgi:hypothetical protein